mgnify:FL=1|jgi:hypothetical protein
MLFVIIVMFLYWFLIMTLDPIVWGPNYWFFLMTIAVSYPKKANSVLKKKYYDFIMNLPLFIPDDKMGNQFSRLLDKFPIEPYLDTRESFIKWVNFIHNQVNKHIGKKEMSYIEAMDSYYSQYKPRDIILKEQIKKRQHMYFGATLIGLAITAYILYKK